MSKNCNCPICRYVRHELTEKEFGWYLKGCIQTYHRLMEHASRFDKLDHDEDRIMLDDLVKLMKDKGENVDIAFLEPENFIPSKV